MYVSQNSIDNNFKYNTNSNFKNDANSIGALKSEKRKTRVNESLLPLIGLTTSGVSSYLSLVYLATGVFHPALTALTFFISFSLYMDFWNRLGK